MKPIRFLGDSLKRLREFPSNARQDAGYQLDKVQNGQQPDDLKPMRSLAMGLKKSGWDDTGTFRVIYTTRWLDAVTSFTPSGKKHKQRRNAIWKSQKPATHNY